MNRTTRTPITAICKLGTVTAIAFASTPPIAWAAYGFIDPSLNKVVYPEHCYIDKAGNVVLKSPYRTDTDQFSNGLVRVEAEQTEPPCYYMDKHGKVVIRGFGRCESFSEGLAAVGAYGKEGFIDANGKLVVSAIFQEAEGFREGLAPIKINNKGGFVDKFGRVVIEPFYDAVACFSEGLAAAQADNKIGFIDKTGKWKIKPKFDFVYGFSDGLALVREGSNQYYIDNTGKTVIDKLPGNNHTFVPGGITYSALRVVENGPFSGFSFNGHEFSNISTFSESLAAMANEGRYGYIDKTGKWAIPAKFELAFPFANGLARVKVSGKYGFIDKTGKLVIEPIYLDARDFRENAAAVSLQKDKWGFIDTNGKLFITPKYAYVWDFSEGLAHVRLDTYQRE